ncbi:hypothetical protein DL96DRAFT_1599401 [Flagelloscypha sp. PMI_526]|nr:hypothetical protein DL96DRAFT_1599401 [Flagelloscypha sp. PMI_526]
MSNILSRNSAGPDSETAFGFIHSSFRNLGLVNGPCYIDALPDELLGRIFSLFRDGCLHIRYNFAWADVCLPVSRRWHHVGLSTSELWRYIFEDRPERLRVVLSRCQAPLIINWRCFSLNFEVRKEWLAVLRSHVDRAEEIQMECNCFPECSLTNHFLEDNIEQKFDSESPALPLLRRLSIYYGHAPLSLENILQNSPKLAELSVIGDSISNITFPTQLGDSSFLYSLRCLVLKGKIWFENTPTSHSLSFPILSELTIALPFQSSPVSICTIIEAIRSQVPTKLIVEVPENPDILGNKPEKISAACHAFHATFAEKGSIQSLQCVRAHLVLPYEWQDYRHSEFTIKLTLASNVGYSTTFYMRDNDPSPMILQGLNLDTVEEIQLDGHSHTSVFMFEDYVFPNVHTIIFSGFAVMDDNLRKQSNKGTAAFRLPHLHSIVMKDCSSGWFPLVGFLKSLYQFGEEYQSRPKLVIEGMMSHNFDPFPLEYLGYVTRVEFLNGFQSSWNEEDELSDWDAYSEVDVFEESDSHDEEGNELKCGEEGDEGEEAESDSDIGTWLLSPDVPLLDEPSEDAGEDPDWFQDPPIAQNFEATTFDYRSYAIIWEPDDHTVFHHTAVHICAMPRYLRFSPEELRFWAYSHGHKFPPPGTKLSPSDAFKEIIESYETFTALEPFCQHSQEELRVAWIQANRPNRDLTSAELLALSIDKPTLPSNF